MTARRGGVTGLADNGRSLARNHHPDCLPGEPDTAVNMTRTEAYSRMLVRKCDRTQSMTAVPAVNEFELARHPCRQLDNRSASQSEVDDTAVPW